MPEKNDYATLKRRFETACDAEGLARSRIEVGPNRPGLAVVDIAGAHTKRLLLTAGIHGDEPAGVEAVLRFLENEGWERFPAVALTVLPCLNPEGYTGGTRENADGVDINRSFHGEGTPESRAIKRFLEGARFDCFYDLHEDVDQTGFYLYEMAEGDFWGEEVVEAVGREGPIALDAEIEDMPASGGIIRPGGRDRGLDEIMRERTDWPMVFHLYQNGVRRGITAETPVKLPFEQRVQMHLAGLDAILNLLSADAGHAAR